MMVGDDRRLWVQVKRDLQKRKQQHARPNLQKYKGKGAAKKQVSVKDYE